MEEAATDISVLVGTYGEERWRDLACERAIPSADAQDAHEVFSWHEEDGTIASVRNWLGQMASGPWLCFLDADDELAPGYIAAIQAADEGDPRVLYTPAVCWARGQRRSAARFQREFPLEHANWLVIGTVISRKLFWEVGGFEDWPHGLEDWNLWAKAWKAGARIVKVPDAVYIAHRNPRSKHHLLLRNRTEYMRWYQAAAHSVFPDIHPPAERPA